MNHYVTRKEGEIRKHRDEFWSNDALFLAVSPNSWKLSSAVLWLMTNLCTESCASLYVHYPKIRCVFVPAAFRLRVRVQHSRTAGVSRLQNFFW